MGLLLLWAALVIGGWFAYRSYGAPPLGIAVVIASAMCVATWAHFKYKPPRN